MQVVRFGGQLVPVPASVMRTLLRCHARAPLDDSPDLSCGRALCVWSRGPFEGTRGRVRSSRAGEDRVQVLVTVLGGLRGVEVAATSLGPV